MQLQLLDRYRYLLSPLLSLSLAMVYPHLAFSDNLPFRHPYGELLESILVRLWG